MSRQIIMLALILSIPASALAEPPHIQNPDTPRDGVQVITLQQQWQRGQEDDELFFGAVRKVLAGPDGNIYALDQQKSEVAVFDRQGLFLRYLSREGEGPGECSRPEDMVFLPDGSLGLAQYLVGKIIKIDLEGIPRETLMPPGFDPQEGGAMSSIRRARWRADTFVINGVRVQPQDDGMVRTQYLVRCDQNAKPLVEYLSRSTSSNLMRDGWIEKNNYFPSHDRWDIDGQGRVLAATERNEYLITVFAQDGSTVLTFGRDFKPWKRTEEQKQEIRDSLTVLRDGQRVQVDVHVENNEPAILSVHWRPDGEIWVLTMPGRQNQEPGIMQTYDVFSPAGEYIRQVAVNCPGDPEEDVLFLLGANQAALVRGAVQARRNTFGGSQGEEKEVPVHDLVYYSF
jgi:hypothetical protein